MKTIYQVAQIAIDLEITKYLELLKATDGLNSIRESDLQTEEMCSLFASGIGSKIPENCTNIAQFLISESNRKSAINFDIETAVCKGVYDKIRSHAHTLYLEAKQETNNFTSFEPASIKSKPYLLPVFQSTLKKSKSNLKKEVGSVTDVLISGPASIKLAELLNRTLEPNDFREEFVLQRMETTLEGIVRDLVGRVLFEEVVAHALQKEAVNFLREDEYSSLSGVIYDFRADFVLPNPENPIAFIEVRKSSSRHASLYAKDKMFSAINWKGKHKNLIGVIVVEGEWSQATLRTMASIFDYVVPLSQTTELAKVLKKAQDGDESVLKWLIQFDISPSPNFSNTNVI